MADPSDQDALDHLHAELDGYRTYLSEVSQELARARELLFRLVGEDASDCQLDTAGRCETHGSDRPCAVRDARTWLGYDTR